MSDRLLRLAQRMRDECCELERLVGRALAGWRRAQRSADDLYLDSVALNLHGFYAGLERLFEMIAASIDGDVPQGENWHQVLLVQMASEVPSVRPAVISEQTREGLDAYRGFRHVVRHVYAFRFDSSKLQKLVDDLPSVLLRTCAEIAAFADFLEEQATADPTRR